MKRIFLLLAALVAISVLYSCGNRGPEKTDPGAAAVRYLLAGSQEDNGFQVWIWIYEDEKLPARVMSGQCRYVDGQNIDTDFESLDCQFSEDGFTLSDPQTGAARYTAVSLDDKVGEAALYHMRLSWSHAPGATWPRYAQERGWQQEMEIHLVVFEGDDIVR